MHQLNVFLYVSLGGFGTIIINTDKKGVRILKMSELCIYLSVFIAFVTTGYLWCTGQKNKPCFHQRGNLKVLLKQTKHYSKSCLAS
jgi:hypothetical protein